MEDVRGYRFGTAVFGLAAVLSAGAVAYASSCCSAVSAEDQAILAGLGAPEWRGMGWVTAALMDWPLGFRLTLMTLTTSIIGFAVALCGLLLASKNNRFSRIFRPVSATILVGIIYILVIYIAGYIGYKGPFVLVAWLGAAALISLMYFPNRNGLILAVPLAVVGFGAAAVISMVMGIGWD